MTNEARLLRMYRRLQEMNEEDRTEVLRSMKQAAAGDDTLTQIITAMEES